MVRGEGTTAQGFASPALIQKHLKGGHYPTSKKAMLQCAKENNAPFEVMAILEMLPDKQYISPADVMKEVGKKE
jgi:hypothetical protein